MSQWIACLSYDRFKKPRSPEALSANFSTLLFLTSSSLFPKSHQKVLNSFYLLAYMARRQVAWITKQFTEFAKSEPPLCMYLGTLLRRHGAEFVGWCRQVLFLSRSSTLLLLRQDILRIWRKIKINARKIPHSFSVVVQYFWVNTFYGCTRLGRLLWGKSWVEFSARTRISDDKAHQAR